MLKEKIQEKANYDPLILDFNGIFDFNDDKLYDFCVRNKELQIERSSKGELIIMPPVGSEGAHHEAIVIHLVQDWNLRSKKGKVFSSSGGFVLPNKAMRSPDTSFMTNERWKELTKEDKGKFAHVCPDFLIEIRSKTDHLNRLKDKMKEWMANGCRLAWLIDPLEGKAYVYRPNKEIETIPSFNEKLSGEDVLPGFELDLSELQEEQ